MKALRHQAGDTIVEVLIAIVVVSAVLVGAYVTTNRNTAFNENSQERAEATRLVQGQIENLRAHSGIDSGQQCYNKAGQPVALTVPEASDCVVAADGTPAGRSKLAYHISIAQPGDTPAGSGATSYAVTAKWDALTGGESNVTMYYAVGEAAAP